MGIKEIKVGLLTISGLVVAYFGFNYLKGNSLISKGNTYYSTYSDVAGLHVGSRVVINGFPVGKVKSIGFHNDGNGKLLVEFVVIDEAIKLPINTTAQVLNTDLFGSKAINIIYGNSSDYAVSGDTLLSAEAKGMLSEVEGKIQPYEEKFNRILDNMDTLLTSVKTTIHSVNLLLEKERKDIGEITSNVVSITDNLEDNNEKISNTLTNLSNISDSLSQVDIKRILENADKAVADMAAAMEKINNGSGTMGKLMNDSTLYVNLNQSATDLDMLLKDMKEHPKRYLHFSIWGKDKEAKKEKKSNK